VTNSPNLDLVRSIYADWERGDFSRADWADPKVEFVMLDGPFPGKWLGLAGMAEVWREMLNAWKGYRVEAARYRTLGDENVLVLSHQTGHGKASGFDLAQMQTENATLFHITDDKVTRLVVYWDSARALADLGLEEEACRRRTSTG
jgi:ketosteroid isomerase-like protein